tara:strand:- start:219 stop:839 length:621 start_codon:yes stop_codon:yes gene_type:complete
MADEYPIVNSLELNLDKIVDWTDHKVKRVRWTNEEIDEKFASRTVSEILKDKNTHYMNPCLELTLCSLDLLKSFGYKNNVIVEFLRHHDKDHEEVHFALESEDGVNKHFLDYSRLNIVYTGRGEYVNPKKDVDSLHRISLDDSLFSRDETYLESFGKVNVPEIKMLIDNYNLDEHKERLKRENTDRNYEAYLAKLSDTPELKLHFV